MAWSQRRVKQSWSILINYFGDFGAQFLILLQTEHGQRQSQKQRQKQSQEKRKRQAVATMTTTTAFSRAPPDDVIADVNPHRHKPSHAHTTTCINENICLYMYALCWEGTTVAWHFEFNEIYAIFLICQMHFGRVDAGVSSDAAMCKAMHQTGGTLFILTSPLSSLFYLCPLLLWVAVWLKYRQAWQLYMTNATFDVAHERAALIRNYFSNWLN